jgi:hypothetical protein
MKKIIFLSILIAGMGMLLIPKGSEASSCGSNYAFSSSSCKDSYYGGSSIGYAFGGGRNQNNRDSRNSNQYSYNGNYDYGFGGYRNSGYNNYAFRGNYGYSNYYYGYYGGNYAFY